ncbi:hypothetical protein Mc24_03258 [Thermotoga sp. Mc24]|uniref:DUF996 domain-containing protein n=1 Tax=Thermotoga sp. Mc24 TaxID=1231241 RepID=UPI0005431D80|nr:DUF996 domain-containing protein [Thermotoga sp. Mc24]KHC92408.1 hypothetical protein Mc24_03258 [Thermotoga sp. Mc24]
MNLSTAKTLAGVGMIFELFGAVPVVGWIFSLVGLILFLIGIYNISQQVGERRIFNYLLIPAVLLLIVSVIFSVSLVASLFAGGLFAGGVTLVSFITIIVLGIIALVYKVKAYRMLAESLKISVFNTAASFYKWGAILLVVFGVGFILMFVGDILTIVGFFSNPSEETA